MLHLMRAKGMGGWLKLEILWPYMATTHSAPKSEQANFVPSSPSAPTGLVIWICEGTKRSHRQVEVVNDNELAVRAFLEHLRSLGRRKATTSSCSMLGRRRQIGTNSWVKDDGYSNHPIHETDCEGRQKSGKKIKLYDC
jgi:hypothetical protein